jgi:hypothetical protein
MKFVASAIEFCRQYCPEPFEDFFNFVIETVGFLLWFIASIVSFILACLGIVLMVVAGYTVGKRWVGENHTEKTNDWSNIMTDCDSWPTWLTIAEEVRIYPAHIGIMILSVLFFTHPEVAILISKCLTISAGSSIALWILMNIIQQWARDLGNPLGTDHEGDESEYCY